MALNTTLAPRTRDGSFSVAAACEQQLLRGADAVSVSPQELVDWAGRNDVDLRIPGDRLALVNGRRAALGLPPFKVAGQVAEKVKARPPGPPLIAATKAELLHTVATLDGVRSGTLTPDCTRWLLELNTAGRPKHPDNVARFCQIIVAGQWRNTGEPIIISKQGILNDGQCRLEAIAKTGIAVEADVRFGVERDVILATGTGRTRTPAQALYIMGEKDSVPRAAVARLVHLHDNGQLFAAGHRQQIETLTIIQVLEKNPAIRDVAAAMVASKFAPTRVAGFGMVLALAARVTTLEQALRFGELVSTARGDDDDPTHSLHVRLRDARMARKRLNSIEVGALAIRGWNMWIGGKRGAGVKLLASDVTAAGFPKLLGATE